MQYSLKCLFLYLKKYPLYIVTYIFNILSGICITICPIYIVKIIVNSFQTGDKSRLLIALVLLIIMFIAKMITVLYSLYSQYISIDFQADFNVKLYRHLSNIDYEFHESSEFLNNYHRALEMGAYNVYLTADNTLNLIKIGFQNISVLTIIATMNIMSILYAFIIGFVFLIIKIVISKLDYMSRTKTMLFNRKKFYVNRMYFVKDAMADIKTTNVKELLLKRHNDSSLEMIKIYDKYNSIKAIISFIGEVLILSIYPVVIWIIVTSSVNIKADDFASLTVAATSLSVLISGLISAIGNIQSSGIECKIPFEVLKTHGKIEGVKYKEFTSDFNELQIKNLSFNYDDNYQVLNNINMTIKKGQKIAIVGSNGAGKTTLVKLLLRLYDPKDGCICINNENYKDLNVISLRTKVGAVFQEVEVYALTIAENVLLRNIQSEEDIELVNNALKFCGLYEYVYSLKDNIYTQVTREFNKRGAIFSGGQVQRLAIARGYAQNYQLFILDEPSSALDPLSEAKVYENMLTLGKDRTIIFISHRLTTTVNADQIYLFEKGQIIEKGTHNELMEKNGIYKKMFTSQASKYLGDNYD